MKDAAFDSAAVVLAAEDVQANVLFFRDRLGFRLETIYPADDPRVAIMSGHGLRLCLDRTSGAAPTTLRLKLAQGVAHAEAMQAPNGTRIEFEAVVAPDDGRLPGPDQAFALTRACGGEWLEGRAGMRYRDLVPGRLRGRLIASHIHIPDGGPVPDYVHYHAIGLQMIYCYRGWVRVVYEDQGEPFVMHAGDCVLQPPEIRHRVLEASDNLQVIEIGCPAEHTTSVEHELTLPNDRLDPAREFRGQRFVRHSAADGVWTASPLTGFEWCDTGIGDATRGLAAVHVLRPRGTGLSASLQRSEAFRFVFVLDGSATLEHAGSAHRMGAGDAFILPCDESTSLVQCAGELALLLVTIPGAGEPADD